MSDDKAVVDVRELAYQRLCRLEPVGRVVLLNGKEDGPKGSVSGRVNLESSLLADKVFVPAFSTDWSGVWVKVESKGSLRVLKVRDLTFVHPPPV